ncbi:MAG: cardiolipin synthase [Xanthomonadales bacterium]|nr:cardiolipin synthase [Xanthomonadales bacterium]
MYALWDWVQSLPGYGPVLAWGLFGGWLLYVVWLGGWIVLQKREPVATLSWLLGLALLPYVGFLIYYLLGPQKIRRHRLRRARSRLQNDALGHDLCATACSPDARELGALAKSATGFAPSTARDVRLLVDGAATYDALIEAIGQARHHVHLEYYIYTPDESGGALREALIACARRGVKVRLLLDAIGSGKCSRAFLAPLVEAGGEVAWFHPTRFWRFWSRPWLNMRTHRKIAVIDTRIGFTGGINITDDENDRLRSDAYRDLHLRLEGDIVRSLQLVFAEDWLYATGQRGFLDDIVQALPPAEAGPISVQAVTSGPDGAWEPIHRLQVNLIHAARERVWLVTPYFVPGEAAMMALTSAALAGLDVRLLVPRLSDSRLVTLAARSYYDDLLAAGVKIHEYGPRMLHTKALLVDDGSAMLGSANFDHRSFRLNFEIALLFQDRGVGGALEALIAGELQAAPQVRDDRARPLLGTRLPESLARLMSPLL